MNLQSGNRCSRLSPEELTRMNMPTQVPPHDTESAGGDEKTPAGERRTGWEDTRPSLTADGKIRFAGRGNLVASSAAHMSSGHSRLALGGLSGLASAVSIIGNSDPDESEEA